jgi:myo-inositol-1(or 4)-monophosphatase
MNEILDITKDIDFAWLEQISKQAGRLALRHFRHTKPWKKPDNTIVTDADREIEDFLRQSLTDAFPEDAVLGEERGAIEGRSGRVWALDPIDGTAAYAAGLPVWGVSIGILHNWWPVAGVFYMPLQDEYYGSDGSRATLNGEAISVDTSQHIDDHSFLCSTSETHRNYDIDFVGKTRIFGSTAAHICYVARGTAVAAVLGRPALWDIAGALPVLQAAGGSLGSLGEGIGTPDLSAMADGRKFAHTMLAGAPWALHFFGERIHERRLA